MDGVFRSSIICLSLGVFELLLLVDFIDGERGLSDDAGTLETAKSTTLKLCLDPDGDFDGILVCDEFIDGLSRL